MKINISDKNIGSCAFNYKKTNNETAILTQKKELAIKALAGLQLVCMSATNDTETFDLVLDTIQDCINIINSNYTHTLEDTDELFANYID